MRVIASYRDLKVWQEAMALAEVAYRLAVKLPRVGGLAYQMGRSAISVPANIAEGYGRELARGSLNELETQILLAQRVQLLDGNQTEPLLSSIESVSKMLNGLIRSIRAHRSFT